MLAASPVILILATAIPVPVCLAFQTMPRRS